MSIFSLFYCVIVMILGRRENGTESYTLLARNKQTTKQKSCKRLSYQTNKWLAYWSLNFVPETWVEVNVHHFMQRHSWPKREKYSADKWRQVDRQANQFRLSAGLIYMQVSCAVSQTHNGSNNAYHKARQYHLPTMQFQSIHFGQTFLLQPLYVPNK